MYFVTRCIQPGKWGATRGTTSQTAIKPDQDGHQQQHRDDRFSEHVCFTIYQSGL